MLVSGLACLLCPYSCQSDQACAAFYQKKLSAFIARDLRFGEKDGPYGFSLKDHEFINIFAPGSQEIAFLSSGCSFRETRGAQTFARMVLVTYVFRAAATMSL